MPLYVQTQHDTGQQPNKFQRPFWPQLVATLVYALEKKIELEPGGLPCLPSPAKMHFIPPST